MPAKAPVLVNKDHRAALSKATSQFQALFESSEQAMYLYLDDANKACNPRFARLLGYADPAAWAAVPGPFPPAFVAPASQHELVGAYQDAMENGTASQVPVTWKRRDGKTVDTHVILAPVDIDRHRLAVHFVTPR